MNVQTRAYNGRAQEIAYVFQGLKASAQEDFSSVACCTLLQMPESGKVNNYKDS